MKVEPNFLSETETLIVLEDGLNIAQQKLKQFGFGNFSYKAILDGACGHLSKKKFAEVRKDNYLMLLELKKVLDKYSIFCMKETMESPKQKRRKRR